MKKFITVTGSSCVGKGPLLAALKEFHPQIDFEEIPVIRSHGSRNGVPRPNETEIWSNPDYFLPDADFAKLDKDRFIIGECRGYPQAIDLKRVSEARKDLLILEVYHTIGKQVKKFNLNDTKIISVFVSPLSIDDIENLKLCGVNTDCYITAMMIHKQIKRNEYMGAALTEKTIKDIVSRAQDAPKEIENIKEYSFVIVNTDGEGSANWNREPGGAFIAEPIGGALRALNEFVSIISGTVF